MIIEFIRIQGSAQAMDGLKLSDRMINQRPEEQRFIPLHYGFFRDLGIN